MLLYYITDRRQFHGDDTAQRGRLLDKITEAARAGVDFIQLRERDLNGRDLESLAREAVRAVRESGSAARILINSRTDVALAAGADGVHLRSDDVSPAEVRAVWQARSDCIVSIACHSVLDVRLAQGTDFAVFAPVFEKSGQPGVGLSALRDACHVGVPVLALGGVTVENTQACMDAGAAGVAGIRLFQAGDVGAVVKALRG